MKYEYTLHRPGIVGFDRKGEPIGETPLTEYFEARSHAEAATMALKMYEQTDLGRTAHYNVSVT